MKFSHCIKAAGFALLVVQFATSASAQTPLGNGAGANAPNIITVGAGQASAQISVPVNKSQLVRIGQRFSEISVGNKAIADVVPLTKNLIYILGKKAGATNLTISNERGNVSSVLDVLVTYDVDALRQGLTAIVPDEHVTVRPEADSLVLTGQISSADHLHEILELADRYAPGKVTNLMTVNSSQQVLLQVRFAEVQRNAEQDLGASFNVTYQKNLNKLELDSGSGIASTAFGSVTGLLGDGHYSLQATIDALEQKGLLRLLAEPNLVALSGDTASFLAGGQIPIPVVQATTGVQPVASVQYKDFGVSLAFTPTVVGKDKINLKVNAEVSAIDKSVSVSTNGFDVPGLSVRRAGTTIELKDGQSFSIAGLLQNNFQDSVSGFPILSDLPVLGALFRSPSYQHHQTELVVLITAHLVDPSLAKNLASPTDSVVLPTPLSLFGTGKLEGAPAGKLEGAPPAPDANKPQAPDANKPQGYVLP